MLLQKAEFAYNNVKNSNTSHILFKVNYKDYSKVSFTIKINYCLKSYFTNKLANKLRDLINVYCQNLFYYQKW